jgi:hypothetical protein
MVARLRSDYLDDSIIAARLIWGGDAPIWLAEQLWRWNRHVQRARHVEEFRLTRAEMRSSLLEVENALLHVTEALYSPWVWEFLDTSPDGPIVDPEGLRDALEDLRYRAGNARDCSDLATKSGVTKPGRGKAIPEGISPHTLCAIMIWEVWKHVRGEEPSPKNRSLAKAAEAYWRSAGGKEHPSEEQTYVDEPLAFWRHHFKKAMSSTAKDFRAEWRRHLALSELLWKRRNSACEAA